MFLKLHNWIFLLGLFASGLSYAVPVQDTYREKETTTEQIVQQKQEEPAAFYGMVTAPAFFAVIDFDSFHFPSFLDLENNRVHLQLKLQHLIFSQHSRLLRQQLLSFRLEPANPHFELA
jgi:hypothetical protein